MRGPSIEVIEPLELEMGECRIEYAVYLQIIRKV